MSKANNKDTRTTPLTSLWCLHHQLRPHPTSHANVPISDPKKANVHWVIKISRENTPKVKPTEVCQEPNKHSQIHHKQKIIGSQPIQIIIFIIKNHYFIFRSIPNKRQGSESTSVLVEYLKAYFHKVEFSVLLKNIKCITASQSGIWSWKKLHLTRKIWLSRKQSQYMGLIINRQ